MSYYTMHYGRLESKLFIILTIYISLERSDSQDSISGGLFVIGVILKNALKNSMEFGCTRWLFVV